MPKVRPVLFVLWLAALAGVTVGTLWPGAGTPPVFPHADKLAHFAAYLLLAALALNVFLERGTAFTVAWSLILYGAGLEVAQKFVPGRFGGLGDVFVNWLGVCAGVWVGFQVKLRGFVRRQRAARDRD